MDGFDTDRRCGSSVRHRPPRSARVIRKAGDVALVRVDEASARAAAESDAVTIGRRPPPAPAADTRSVVKGASRPHRCAAPRTLMNLIGG
jgi:hypothetical protein